MGTVFGKTGAKDVEFETIKAGPYEVRKYGGFIAAEVAIVQDQKDNAFTTLMNYVGTYGTPQNNKGNKDSTTISV